MGISEANWASRGPSTPTLADPALNPPKSMYIESVTHKGNERFERENLKFFHVPPTISHVEYGDSLKISDSSQLESES